MHHEALVRLLLEFASFNFLDAIHFSLLSVDHQTQSSDRQLQYFYLHHL